MLGQSLELGQAMFGKRPEAFDALDVRTFGGALISAMLPAQVLGVADVGQAVVAAPAVAVDEAAPADLAANGFWQGLLATVGDHFGIDAALALEDSQDDGLAAGAAAALAAHAPGTEVAFIVFPLPPAPGRDWLARRPAPAAGES